MADGGAWQSGVFDNGSGFQKTAAPTGTGADAKVPVAGVPPAMYNPPASIASGRDGAYMPVIAIALRCACTVFCVIGFSIIASDSGSDYYVVGVTYYYIWWKALNSASLRYLLAVDVIVCAYSIVQVVLSFVKLCIGKTVLSGPTTPASTITFVCDQALTYMLMAGCGAGAGFLVGIQRSESGSSSCDGVFQVFCDKGAASVAMSFIAFLCIALSTAMAYFRMYRVARR